MSSWIQQHWMTLLLAERQSMARTYLLDLVPQMAQRAQAEGIPAPRHGSSPQWTLVWQPPVMLALRGTAEGFEEAWDEIAASFVQMRDAVGAWLDLQPPASRQDRSSPSGVLYTMAHAWSTVNAWVKSHDVGGRVGNVDGLRYLAGHPGAHFQAFVLRQQALTCAANLDASLPGPTLPRGRPVRL